MRRSKQTVGFGLASTSRFRSAENGCLARDIQKSRRWPGLLELLASLGYGVPHFFIFGRKNGYGGSGSWVSAN